jgi:hypothetical protein
LKEVERNGKKKDNFHQERECPKVELEEKKANGRLEV